MGEVDDDDNDDSVDVYRDGYTTDDSGSKGSSSLCSGRFFTAGSTLGRMAPVGVKKVMVKPSHDFKHMQVYAMGSRVLSLKERHT